MSIIPFLNAYLEAALLASPNIDPSDRIHRENLSMLQELSRNKGAGIVVFA